ncbi:MAG: hypothetical protein VYE18_08130, partial [Pseudomonadota bacterium]|nr:hypothetical protein [Pseudomonadota bacterium]
GQGHSLYAAIGARALEPKDDASLMKLFLEQYIAAYNRPLEGIPVECVSLSLRVSSVGNALPVKNILAPVPKTTPDTTTQFDLDTGRFEDVPTFDRQNLSAGQSFDGPGLIKDNGTTICIPKNFSVICSDRGPIILTRHSDAGGN